MNFPIKDTRPVKGNSLLVRVDASSAMGTGHVMRCLALGQAWQDAGGAKVVFVMSETTPALDARLAAESFEVVMIDGAAGSADDARRTINLGLERRTSWIVVDGYQFAAEYQRALQTAGFRTLFIDDFGHASSYSADLVLNQNISARQSLYVHRDPPTRLLLGPHYCVMRREFSKWRNSPREIPPTGRRVLVTMGGSDPENVAARVTEALRLVKVSDLEATVVVGGSSPHVLQQQHHSKIRVVKDITNIGEWMAWADAGVSSAGTTCWELCLLGLPSLLIDVADNQRAVAQELGRRQCAIHFGSTRDFDARQLAARLESLLRSQETRRVISSRSRRLVDGLGAKRIVAAMQAGLRLRSAREQDCRLLWEWANDLQVRASAFSSAPIPWENHQIWFANKLRDPECRILIAADETGAPVGQLRVDWRSENEADIDVSVAREYRGAGYAAPLIDLAVDSVFSERGSLLHAMVKTENQASRRAFEQAGFVSLGAENLSGHAVVHYVRANELSTHGEKEIENVAGNQLGTAGSEDRRERVIPGN